MPADVRSIAAVIDWRSDLTNYGDLLAEAMAGVDLEIRRAADWLEEQLSLWKKSIRDCEEDVVRAKAELAQRKFPNWDGREPDCTVQERALRLAKARLEHAEEKVETVRRWIGRLPKLIDEMFTGPSRRLKSMLEADIPNALAELGRRIASLETYASLRADYAPGPSNTEPTPLPEGKGEMSSPSPLAGEGSEQSERVRGETSTTEFATPSPGGEAPPPSPARGEGKMQIPLPGGVGSSGANEEKP